MTKKLICCLYPVLEENTWKKFLSLTTRAVHPNEHNITKAHNYCRDNSKFMAELGVPRNLDDLGLHRAISIRLQEQIRDCELISVAVWRDTCNINSAAEIVLYIRRRSRLVSSRQGNELDRLYAMISLWYFIFRVAVFLVNDTPECRVQKYFFRLWK